MCRLSDISPLSRLVPFFSLLSLSLSLSLHLSLHPRTLCITPARLKSISVTFITSKYDHPLSATP